MLGIFEHILNLLPTDNPGSMILTTTGRSGFRGMNVSKPFFYLWKALAVSVIVMIATGLTTASALKRL
jgi:hypothetical protein